ncbi:MAG TPA: nucleotidyl transferase AbiEii/AbiGii toxin family protein [Gemmatimonadaceae bacterium]|nr:nucleotidyl transferase AbiEii/AbiGii toxin family protein [Gemmatimonadaceae bacterium]
MSATPSVRWLADAPEFEDAVRAAANHHGILPDLVRKDYWVTRVLRAIASDPAHAGRVLFKGGTSLSKGWRLIDRFSEDVDLLLTSPAYGPAPDSRKEREHQFRALKACIEAETPLRLPDQKALTRDEWEFLYIRSDFHCNMRYPLPGRRASREGPNTDSLLVEAGFRGGAQPHARRPLTSLVAEFVDTQPTARAALEPYAADLTPFEMDLLKPERTFAEKLLALHVGMSDGEDGARLVRTRHYYDIAQLFGRSGDVRDCLARGEFAPLVREAVAVSNTHWNAGLDAEALDLRMSPALHPTPAQIRVLAASYESERALYYRDWVPFDDILAAMHAISEAL